MTARFFVEPVLRGTPCCGARSAVAARRMTEDDGGTMHLDTSRTEFDDRRGGAVRCESAPDFPRVSDSVVEVPNAAEAGAIVEFASLDDGLEDASLEGIEFAALNEPADPAARDLRGAELASGDDPASFAGPPLPQDDDRPESAPQLEDGFASSSEPIASEPGGEWPADQIAEDQTADEAAAFPFLVPSLSAEEPIELELVTADEPVPALDPVVVRSSVAGSVVSVLLHVWLLFVLAGIVAERPPALYEPPLESRFSAPDPPEEQEQVVEYELANPDDRELEVRKVLNAKSVGMVQNEAPPVAARPTFLPEEVAMTVSRPVYDIPEGMEVDQQVVVQGTTGENLIQLESALDRVTWEIAQNMKENKVLVVWLLDASGSLTPQRAAIEKRLKRIYGELGAMQELEQIPRLDRPLLTGVVAYGQGTTFLTKEPTDKFEAVQEAFRSLETDETGIENVFTAVGQVLKQWSKYRANNGRRILLVTVTDETGDDFGPPMEAAIAQCRRYSAKAYVLGPSAAFGRRKGFLPYVAPEDGKTYNLPVDLGPETAMIETVNLPFWYEGPQYTYLSSGFGPYALSRLVNETGGVYFMTSMTTMAGLAPLGTFDKFALKPFVPDYRFGSPREYEADLRKHPLRAAVVAAALLAEETQPKGTPNLDLRVTPGNFRQVATTNQQTAAESQYAIDTILQAFPQGIEKELENEPSPRWRMQFCLSYGRLLAQKTRCLEYNAALAHMKGSLTPDDVATKSNHWLLRPDGKLNYAPTMTRSARLAEELLKRVVNEAPGTPWAILAARELQDPFGIRVVQRFIPPPPPGPPPGAAPQGKPGVRLAPDPKKPAPAPPRMPPTPPKLPRV